MNFNAKLDKGILNKLDNLLKIYNVLIRMNK